MISFTIITCTYNAAQTLPRTLASVRQQGYAHVQHLIIDGCSTDATLALINRYCAENEAAGSAHRVEVTVEKDRGLYDAMNKGIQKASGDYLVFLNAGDVFPSAHTLELLASNVDAAEALPGVLYGDTHIVDDSGQFLRRRRLQPPPILSWKSFKQGMLVCHQAFYILSSIAKETPYNLAYRYSADVDWCIRVMKKAEENHLELRFVDAVLVNYLDEGMTTANHKASLKERFRVMCAHYGWFTTLLMHVWFTVRAVIKK